MRPLGVIRLSDGARAVSRSQRVDSERRVKVSMRTEVRARCGRGPSALRDKQATASPVFNHTRGRSKAEIWRDFAVSSWNSHARYEKNTAPKHVRFVVRPGLGLRR